MSPQPRQLDNFEDYDPRAFAALTADDKLASYLSDPLEPIERSDPPGSDLEIVAWHELYAGVLHEVPIVDGLAFRGRWTSLVAPAKAGKSTLVLGITTAIARGLEPFTDDPRDPVSVLLIDAEMGRVDVLERLDELDLKPADLARLHYVDVVPKLDTIEGAAKLVNAAARLDVALVVIDGVNGAVTGAENDDTTWRAFYDLTVAPLKRLGVAVTTTDNLGKDRTLGPRGSSVKVDKPDAVVEVTRTDDGVKLRTTHRRTAAYPLEQSLRILGVDEGEPIRYRYSTAAWPAGTAAKAAELDELGVPLDASRRAARQAFKAAGWTAGRDDVLAAAIRFRKTGTTPGTTPQSLPGTSEGNLA
jgi:hypothetical protein